MTAIASEAVSKVQFSQHIKGPTEHCDWCDAPIPREHGGYATRARNDYVCSDCGNNT
jgi:hypothetical protein